MATVPDARDDAVVRATSLVGASVAGTDGVSVGTIAEVMLTAARGQIVYVALSVGGILGIGERLLAVPWSSFVVDPVGGALSLAFDRDRLDAIEGFDKDCWPTGPDPRLAA